MITKEEYERSLINIKQYKKCDWCKKIIKIEEAKDTWEYGQHKYWCLPCYEGIKDD